MKFEDKLFIILTSILVISGYYWIKYSRAFYPYKSSEETIIWLIIGTLLFVEIQLVRIVTK